MNNSEQGSNNYGSNPIDSNFNVNISMPECVEIEMVNANSLSEYEHWGTITNIMTNFLIGIFIAFLTIDTEKADVKELLGYLSLIFLGFVLYSIRTTIRKRKLMKSNTKKISMQFNRVTEV